jgi:hypothetical protein
MKAARRGAALKFMQPLDGISVAEHRDHYGHDA